MWSHCSSRKDILHFLYWTIPWYSFILCLSIFHNQRTSRYLSRAKLSIFLRHLRLSTQPVYMWQNEHEDLISSICLSTHSRPIRTSNSSNVLYLKRFLEKTKKVKKNSNRDLHATSLIVNITDKYCLCVYIYREKISDKANILLSSHVIPLRRAETATF